MSVLTEIALILILVKKVIMLLFVFYYDYFNFYPRNAEDVQKYCYFCEMLIF